MHFFKPSRRIPQVRALEPGLRRLLCRRFFPCVCSCRFASFFCTLLNGNRGVLPSRSKKSKSTLRIWMARAESRLLSYCFILHENEQIGKH